MPFRPMQVQVQLVHAEPGRRVVLVSAIGPQGPQAMALGEGDSAEEAEDRARKRLMAVLGKPSTVAPAATPALPTRVPIAAAKPKPSATEPQPSPAESMPEAMVEAVAETVVEAVVEAVAEPPADPEDWSAELAQLELQLKRLGWSRQQESTYLLRAFGHGSRSRLTRYSDLMAYLRALEALAPGADPSVGAVPLRRSDLLGQCDQLLSQLGWDAGQGRQLLESHFQRSSRQQLSDSQLLEFNMLLEGELLNDGALSNAGSAG